MKYRPLFYLISFLLITTSIFSIVKWGFKTSIDFAGGSILEASFPSQPDKSKLNDIFNQQNLPLNSISLANQKNYLFKFQNITPETKIKLNENLIQNMKSFALNLSDLSWAKNF
jgi:preprotein translocase subunit SecF